jgi:hypothetical protein
MKAPRVVITNPLCKAGFARGNQSRQRSPQPAAGAASASDVGEPHTKSARRACAGNRQFVLRTESAGVVAIGDESGGKKVSVWALYVFGGRVVGDYHPTALGRDPR